MRHAGHFSFEVACNFPHERSRDADISLPAGCNNKLLDEPEGDGTDNRNGLEGMLILSQVQIQM